MPQRTELKSSRGQHRPRPAGRNRRHWCPRQRRRTRPTPAVRGERSTAASAFEGRRGVRARGSAQVSMPRRGIGRTRQTADRRRRGLRSRRGAAASVTGFRCRRRRMDGGSDLFSSQLDLAANTSSGRISVASGPTITAPTDLVCGAIGDDLHKATSCQAQAPCHSEGKGTCRRQQRGAWPAPRPYHPEGRNLEGAGRATWDETWSKGSRFLRRSLRPARRPCADAT